MRYIGKVLLSLLLIYFVCSFTVWAGEEKAKGDVKLMENKGNFPKVKFKELSHDFGITPQDSTLKYTFNFKNIGKDVLLIENVKAGWGCTAALASAKEIPPGGEGKIDVTFRAGSRGGKVQKDITVTTNDPDNKYTSLSISANVEVLLAVNPTRINFGQIKKNEIPAPQYVSLTGKLKDTVKITSIKSMKKFIKAETNPSGFENDKDKKIKISILPGGDIGRFNSGVICTTDSDKVKNINFYVYGSILGNISVVPSNVSFRLSEDRKADEKTIKLKSISDSSFKILDVKSSIPELTTKVETIKKGKEYNIKVMLQKGFDKPFFQGVITITTDDKEQSEIKAKVFGRAARQAKRPIKRINKKEAPKEKMSK